MNKGKILKLRSGRDANCSSSTYIGAILISFVVYLGLLGLLAIVQAFLRTRQLTGRLGPRTRVAWWVVPHLLILTVFLVLAFLSGAMNYGSSLFVMVLAVIMLIGLTVGWRRVETSSRAAEKAARVDCPICGYHAQLEDAESCPECGSNLAQARLALFESRAAAGLCPTCGSPVASYAENCPQCRTNLPRGR